MHLGYASPARIRSGYGYNARIQSSGMYPRQPVLGTASPVGRARVKRKGNGLPGLRKRVSSPEQAFPRAYRGRRRPHALLGTAAPVGRARVERKGNHLPGLRKRVSPAEPAVLRPDRRRGR